MTTKTNKVTNPKEQAAALALHAALPAVKLLEIKTGLPSAVSKGRATLEKMNRQPLKHAKTAARVVLHDPAGVTPPSLPFQRVKKTASSPPAAKAVAKQAAPVADPAPVKLPANPVEAMHVLNPGCGDYEGTLWNLLVMGATDAQAATEVKRTYPRTHLSYAARWAPVYRRQMLEHGLIK